MFPDLTLLKYRLGTVHEYPCPDCGGRLILSLTAKGLGYICENKDTEMKCKGNAGAHDDGRPMGTPGTREVRVLRTQLHYLFDPLWKQHRGPRAMQVREQMIAFMKNEFVQLEEIHEDEEFHFANLDERQLGIALKIVQTKLRRRFS